MIAPCCPRPPARAARWPHPQRAARALGPPRRCRVEAPDAQRPGETRRSPWGRPHPAPAGRCGPSRRTFNAARVPIVRGPETPLWGRDRQEREAAGRRRGRRRMGGLPRGRLRLGGAPYLLRSARADRCQRPPVGVLLRSGVLLPRLFPRAFQFSAAVLIVLMDVEQDARTAALVGEARWVGSPSDRVMTGPSALRMSLGPSPIPRHVRRATASMSTRSGTILPSGQDCPDSNGRASLWACANR